MPDTHETTPHRVHSIAGDHRSEAEQPQGTPPAPDESGQTTRAEAEHEGLVEQVEQPAKVMRIGTMIKQLLEEVRAAPLDEAGRRRLAEIHASSIRELETGLAPELREELDRLTLPFTGPAAAGAPSHGGPRDGHVSDGDPRGGDASGADLSDGVAGGGVPSDYVRNDHVPNDYVPNDYVPSDYVPSEAELRIAQAQLVGWLEGLFHGIQTALFAQQMAARQQLEEMRRRALPPGSQQAVVVGPGGQILGTPGFGGGRPGDDGQHGTGQYL